MDLSAKAAAGDHEAGDLLKYAHVALGGAGIGGFDQKKPGLVRPGLQHPEVAGHVGNTARFGKRQVMRVIVRIDLVAQDGGADPDSRTQALGAARIVVYRAVRCIDAVHGVAPRTFLFALPAATVATWDKTETEKKCELKKPKPRCTMRPWTSKLQMRSLSEL